MDVYRAEVTFLIPIGEMDFSFFSIIILCCIIGHSVIYVSKAEINNNLISKDCLM